MEEEDHVPIAGATIIRTDDDGNIIDVLHFDGWNERTDMNGHDEELNDWGIEFIRTIDEKVQEPGNEDVLEAWKEGDFDTCYDWLKETYPELSTDQLDWIEEFLSEV